MRSKSCSYIIKIAIASYPPAPGHIPYTISSSSSILSIKKVAILGSISH